MESNHKDVTSRLQALTGELAENPTAQTLQELTEDGWSFDARNQSLYEDLKDDVEELAETLTQTDNPGELTEFSGIGGPAATELLFHRDPETHLLWNSRTDSLLEAAGYEDLTGNRMNHLSPETALEQYDEVREAAEEIHARFDLPTLVEDATGVDCSDRTVYEVFDHAAYLHDEGHLTLNQRRAVIADTLGHEFMEAVDGVLDEGHYDDLDEVTRDAFRRLLNSTDIN